MSPHNKTTGGTMTAKTQDLTKEIPRLKILLQKSFTSLTGKLDKTNVGLTKKLATLRKERKTLLDQGIDYGSAARKKQNTNKNGDQGEYFRVYYSDQAQREMRDIGKPVEKQFGYVKKDDVEEKLQQMERAKRVREIDQEIGYLESNVNSIEREVRNINESITDLGRELKSVVSI
jgi:hypothetical protein